MKHLNNSSFSFCLLSALAFAPMLFVKHASAHGYSTYPEARQLTCYNEGGIWSGEPRTEGCAKAKEISGSYPFVQKNEFSINIPDYLNQTTVETAVPDGTLCHANDPRKRGMSLINDPSAWTRTQLTTGEFTYTFNATAPHNPSFWKFYITKQGTDLRQPLKWSDLELLKEDNDTIVGNNYSTNLTIPNDRSGDHILFVRWQRIDAVGEGFYNCSDITVVNEDITPPAPDEPYLVQGSDYLLPKYSIGDRLILDVINRYGDVHNSFNIDVTSENEQYIPELLASEVNGYYDRFHNGNVFIGAWHTEMNHYMYFDNGMSNYFNSRNANASYKIRVEAPTAETISLALKELLPSDHTIEYGHYAFVSIEGDFNNYEIEELTNSGIEFTLGSDYVVISAKAIDKERLPTEITLRVIADGNEVDSQQTLISFTVIDGSDNTSPPSEHPVWDPSITYTNGDLVSFDNQTWEAQWWVSGGDNPKETYNSNIWGVWRPNQ